MAYTTESSYTGNGSTTEFLVTFPFLESTDIKARVNGVDTSAFTITGNTVTFTTAPPNTQAVLLYRDTDIDKTKVVFHAGASIRAQDLNNTSKQLLYAIQEEEQNTGGVAFDTGNKGQISVNTANSWVINNDVISNAMMTVNSIDSDQYVDGSIDLAHMSSESVDEDNLKISNAGTNNQFLQKQSGNTGGLTWADANNYSHPNHTGEVTSSGDGATTIVDNIVDEANLKISNAGSNGDYLQKQSGNTGGLTWAGITTGKVVKYQSVTSTSSVTFSADTWTDTGLSITYTPASSASTIIITAYLNLWGKTPADSAVTSRGDAYMRILEGSNVVGEQQYCTWGLSHSSSYDHYVSEKQWQFTFHQEYDNTNTNAKTFKIQLYEETGIIQLNDGPNDDGLSYFTIMEIAD